MPDDNSTEVATPPPAESDSFGSSDYGISDFLREAKEVETPNVTYSNPQSMDPDEEEHKEIPDKSEDEVTPEPKPQTPALPEVRRQPDLANRQQPKVHRKFDGLAEDEIPLFKAMSNPAYDRIYPEWIKRGETQSKIEQLTKDLETANSRRWYEEDGAWSLHPEAKELQANLSDLDLEKNYWEEQLALLEDGKPANDLIYKDGKYFREAELPPTASSKALVISKMQEVFSGKSRLEGRMNSLKSSFKGRYDGIRKGLSEVHKTMFGALDLNKPHIKSAYESSLSKIPSEFRDKEEFQMLAKADVMINGLVSIIRQMEAEKGVKSAVKKVAVTNGPRSSAHGGNGEPDRKVLDSRFGL